MSTSWRMPVSPATGCSEHSSRATTLRGRFQLVAWYMTRREHLVPGRVVRNRVVVRRQVLDGEVARQRLSAPRYGLNPAVTTGPPSGPLSRRGPLSGPLSRNGPLLGPLSRRGPLSGPLSRRGPLSGPLPPGAKLSGTPRSRRGGGRTRTDRSRCRPRSAPCPGAARASRPT